MVKCSVSLAENQSMAVACLCARTLNRSTLVWHKTHPVSFTSKLHIPRSNNLPIYAQSSGLGSIKSGLYRYCIQPTGTLISFDLHTQSHNVCTTRTRTRTRSRSRSRSRRLLHTKRSSKSTPQSAPAAARARARSINQQHCRSPEGLLSTTLRCFHQTP